MKTMQERFMELDEMNKRVANRLIEEIVVCLLVCHEHVISKHDNDVIYDRIGSDLAILCGLLKYDNEEDLLKGIIEITTSK